MPFQQLISTQELADQLSPRSWIILDCRFDLLNPTWGQLNYQQAHIPGSVFADLNLECSAPVTPLSGRHPLPDPESFVDQVSRWGIQPQTQVVVVDSTNGTYAARIWWMLRAIGHLNVAVLDGGFLKWQRENRPVESGIVNPTPVEYRYPATYSHMRVKSTIEILENIQTSRLLLLDARAPERYRGEIEPIDSVAGHIPGALNRPTAANLNPDGTFKAVDVLRKEYDHLLQGTPANQVVVYCGSGVTSCHNLLAMDVASFKGAALYPGSWSEWIRDPSRPIEIS